MLTACTPNKKILKKYMGWLVLETIPQNEPTPYFTVLQIRGGYAYKFRKLINYRRRKAG